MKNKILLVLLLFSLLSVAQEGNNITLDWKDNVTSFVGELQVTIPQFQPEYLSYEAGRKALLFKLTIPGAASLDENSLRITNIAYETISREQLGDLSAALPGNINAKIQSVKARNDWYAVLSLSPIIKEGGNYKRVKSFTYSYTSGANASALRSINAISAVSNSVLSSGDWFRFYVERSGVYKVSRSFLQQLGFDVNVDPRTIKIYGNGGRMLPLLNSTPYPLDLAENAITFVGGEDGVFNQDDYILFYAEGVDNWNAENGTHNNLYADRTYYYVTSQGGDGKRMFQMGQPSGAPTVTVTSFDDYYYHEKDLINIARLGRKWHGEQFNVNNEQDFQFDIPGLDTSFPLNVVVSAASTATAITSMGVKVNGQQAGNINFAKVSGDDLAEETTFSGQANAAAGTITVSLSYNNNGVPGSNAFLDYIIIKCKTKLQGFGKQFRFQYNDAATAIGVAEYQLGNASGIAEVWDITNIYDPVKVVNPGQGQFSFKADLGQVRKYITVVPSDYYTPVREGRPRIANQNLKGTIFQNAQGQFQDLDYMIITPEFLRSTADKLADFHRSQSQLNVKVVTLESIYQEFSSGKQDIGAVRNFVKYVYGNASSPDRKIKYLNLFGDASFDFKDRIPNNTNIVPILHAYDPNGQLNFSSVSTFVSDDFFGLMDPNEGQMLLGQSEALDIAVGRMLVSSVKQAEEMVNKVIEYKDERSYGRWRNEYIAVADDLDESGEQLMPTVDGIAQALTAAKPFINVRKIYTDSYVQQTSSGGARYPEARQQIISSINNGALALTYMGHGGEDGMAHERIFETSDAQTLTNRFKYPLFITATCELTKFDNPYRPTAGEYIYWNPTGGAIAMITTTRSILISTAITFSPLLSTKLFAFDGGEYPTMAEALRQAKIGHSSLARVISFVGDPALKLAIPKPMIVLTELNDVPIAQSADVLKSLSYVKLGGKVTDEAGNLLSNYKGELAVTVFDKDNQRNTLGNDAPFTKVNFITLGETIFRGNASVNNGIFEFGFVVPKDIRIPVGAGKVSFYAKKESQKEDQTGYDTTIKVGGVNENAAADTTPPRVKLYMNDESFISGGITNESPFFLAFLEDENGISTASGIGHDLIGILDGDENNPYTMNDYYETELDSYTKGKLRFPFKNLAKGLHTLTFKAWDVYNNLITAEIQFVVVGDDALTLEKVLNYPNPFVSYTEFWFTHNRPFEPLDVQVQIFTVTGKVVKTINQVVTTEGFLCRDIKWDGRDDFGDRIGKGVYIYKLTVKSTTTNKKAEKYEKLVLL